MTRQFHDITIDLTVRKQSADPVFDQVIVRLSDAANRNMNQKYVFF